MFYCGEDNSALAANTVVIGGEGITGSTVHTVYVPNLNIKTDTGISFGAGAVMIMATLDMDDWDMDATQAIVVNHGRSATEWKTIRDISILIRNDADTEIHSLNKLDTDGFFSGLSSTAFNLQRVSGGSLDNTGYDATSDNRGWVTYWYTPDL